MKLYGQNSVHVQYNSFNGLASNLVYDILQSEDGHIWVATGQGVSRFDGRNFTTFDSQNGLRSNTSLILFEDSKNQIWVSHYNMMPSVIRGDSVCLVTTKEKVRSYPATSFAEKNGYVHWGCHINRIVRADSLLQVTRAHSKEDLEGKMVSTNVIGYPGFEDGMKGDTLNPVYWFSDIRFKKVWESYNQFLTRFIKGNTHEIVPDGKLYQFRSKSTGPRLDNLIERCIELKIYLYDLLMVNEDEWWLATENQGVFVLKFEGSKIIEERFMYVGKSVHELFMDKDKGVWVGTRGNGLFYIPYRVITYKEVTDKKYRRIYVSPTGERCNIYLDNQVDYYHPDHGWKRYDLGITLDIMGALRLEEGGFIIMVDRGDDLFHVDYNGIESIPFDHRLFDVEMIGDTLFATTLDGILIGDKKGNHRFSISWNKFFQKEIVYNAYFEGNQVSLVTRDRVWVVDDWHRLFDEENPLSKDDFKPLPDVGSGVVGWFKLGDNQLFTKQGKDLILQKGDQFINLGDYSPLKKEYVWVKAQNDTTLWLGGKKEACRMILREDTYETLYFDHRFLGLNGEELNSFRMANDTLWLTTPTRMISIPLKDQDYLAKSIDVQSKMNGAKITGSNDQLLLEEDHIALDVTVCHFGADEKLQFDFVLDGEHQNIESNTSGHLSFPALKPGEYSLNAEISNSDRISPAPVHIGFLIPTPFWNRLWVRTLLILLASGVLFMVIYARLKKKVMLEKQMAGIELKALRSQMNPHFTFNVISAVQAYLTTENPEKVRHYLGQFAKLIRSVLNQSRFEMIALEEEVETLEVYLSLEQLRMGHRFDFEVTMDDDLAGDEQLPGMLVQPFVENAIIHGVAHLKDRPGMIQVDFAYLTDDRICCTIKDNGIGLEKSKEINRKIRKKHQSHATDITNERILLYNKVAQDRLNFKIEDIHENGSIIGTQVTLDIPIK